MSGPEEFQLFASPITCHAFNADRTQVAVSPNSHEVYIYARRGDGWTHTHTLSEHDKLVTSIDWAPKTNRIATASQDRNAYVWVHDAPSDTWKPTLVLLRFNRAATTIRWSPHENKFAVGSGARQIAICYFEEENDWWVSKHLKKPLRSTVLSLAWHPDNILLVAGAADMKARVFSAWVKGLDVKASDPVWGERLPFGTVCGEFGHDAGGWVHDVAFAPQSRAIAWVSHDSSVNIATGPQDPVVTIRTNTLPFVSLLWASETALVVAGHDCTPYLVAKQGGTWQLAGKLDVGQRKSVTASNAMSKFRQMDSRAQQINSDTELETVHQNTITSVRAYSGSGPDPAANVTHFSTSGVDGKLAIWDLLSTSVSRMTV
ncbi:hypothetical protein CXG81DRAFT_29299 [Caulochytrium protostelioides]|uniref:Actin-related protein 2/3 complex subunit n=1 Tax=Caulochytrium protostelioides TaxID=1555241 RepID=A0A4P9XD49_9FUNG|nr:hypothetical protein CXG81DRAFT_29299 [Caulochytrium protostelioides]|eukprot:RKP03362.1 hypothetical protein CXG81DRAFT_29299 [Caulochytrium protostelioides]